MGELSPDGTYVWGSADSWDPLWLLPAEVVAAARERYGLSAERPVLLAEGLLNQSWRLATPSGAFVLRVIRPDAHLDQVRYEHNVTARLHDRVPEIVTALPGLDGDSAQSWGGQLLVLFAFIDGATAATLPAGVWEPWAARTLARIHQAGMAAGLRQRPGARRVDEQPTIWAALGPVLWDQLDHTGEVLQLLRGIDGEAEALDRWSRDALSSWGLAVGTVHGDYNPRNLLVTDHGIVAVLDWETVHLDALLVDLADVLVAARRPVAYWETYQRAGGPVDNSELGLLPGLARRHALQELQFAVDENGHAKPQALRKLREVTATLNTLPAADEPGWRPGCSPAA